LASKLANQESEKSAPKVSKLPLPISDSPLVIDLPDGQKIVVGKMTQGSVIEVATWRGVGRPDSRTSRLMLGMGSGNVNEDTDGVSQKVLQELSLPFNTSLKTLLVSIGPKHLKLCSKLSHQRRVRKLKPQLIHHLNNVKQSSQFLQQLLSLRYLRMPRLKHG
jgi:hypothetical protein